MNNFSSPDSDDTYYGDDSEEGRDDQYLVSDRYESKFYGSVHGGSTAGSTTAAGSFNAASANITRSIKAATYLCPAIFPWVDTGPATEESGYIVLKMVGVFYVLIIVFDIMLVVISPESSTFTYIILYTLLIAIIIVLGAISRKPQNKYGYFTNLFMLLIFRYFMSIFFRNKNEILPLKLSI
ncbi:uncharacterized protein LOC126909900 [Daktulosphaira vitifoliae]|uniref:uncharacterized protein LOC126909900 n=1 Tax=Daktulosphaira vitifoliae TaxID=58002 RepID=UPI0021AA9FD4|nr:uncharacterized protein LOC126909900 [Daktulosphaira vitifoliae]